MAGGFLTTGPQGSPYPIFFMPPCLCSSCALWLECVSLVNSKSSFMFQLFKEALLAPNPYSYNPTITESSAPFFLVTISSTRLWLHYLPYYNLQVRLSHSGRAYTLFVSLILRAGTVGIGVVFVGQMDILTDGWMDEWIQVNVILFTKSQNSGTTALWIKRSKILCNVDSFGT